MTDSRPAFVLGTRQEREKEEPILWSLLPSWIQFDLPPGTTGTATPIAAKRWVAGISCMKFKGPAHDRLVSCLNFLDKNGFDGTGIVQPNRSYFLTCMTGGRQMNVLIKTEYRESGRITVVSTFDPPAFGLHYSADGTQLPRSNP
jgi:hypothetical protein